MDAWILATLLVYFLGNLVGASETKAHKVACPAYLPEGEDLTCECHAMISNNTCKTYWLGRTDEPRLQILPSVTRDDNGRRFTCETDCAGQKSSTDYTLQVAYGPLEGSVSVQGPLSFLADGDQTMTLTCVPGDVNPAPSFKWRNNDGLRCENGDTENTCVLRPQYFHHGKSVSCRVTNEQTDTVVTADFTVNLIYPPPKEPLLSGYTKGIPLKQGAILKCAVNGGNPPVSTVILNCSDQAFSCQSITTGDSCVTSCQLNFTDDKRDTKEIQCSCSAAWEPNPQLYVYVPTETIKVGSVEVNKQRNSKDNAEAEEEAGLNSDIIIGLSVSGGVLAVIIVVVIILIHHRRNPSYEKPPPRREDEHLYTGLQVVPSSREPQPYTL